MSTAMHLAQLPVCTEHTATGTAYADLMIDGHRETWPIRSRRFRAFLRRSYYRATGTAASASAINGALEQLEARAQFDGPERVVHLRVAEGPVILGALLDVVAHGLTRRSDVHFTSLPRMAD